MGALELEDKSLIPPLKLFLQGMTNTGYREGIKLIRRSAQDGDQYLIRRIPRQKFMKFKTVHETLLQYLMIKMGNPIKKCYS